MFKAEKTSNTIRGFIRVRYDGNLGFITDGQAAWTEHDATVACKQVNGGYDGGFPILGTFRRWLDRASTWKTWYHRHPVFLSNPKCNGNEKALHKCPGARLYPGPGEYANVVAAFCYKKSLASGWYSYVINETLQNYYNMHL
jgi:hypothetical protein